MSAQRAIEAVFLGYYVDEQYAEAEAGTNEQDSPEHRNRATHLAHYGHQAHIGAEGLEFGAHMPICNVTSMPRGQCSKHTVRWHTTGLQSGARCIRKGTTSCQNSQRFSAGRQSCTSWPRRGSGD